MTTAPRLPSRLIGHYSREQFISVQHYEAWRLGMPLRRHLERRKKIGREERDQYFRHHPYRCSFCPSTSLLTLDHIVPQVLGGSSIDVNLRPACLSCNRAAWKPFAQYLRAFDQWLADVAA